MSAEECCCAENKSAKSYVLVSQNPRPSIESPACLFAPLLLRAWGTGNALWISIHILVLTDVRRLHAERDTERDVE